MKDRTLILVILSAIVALMILPQVGQMRMNTNWDNTSSGLLDKGFVPSSTETLHPTSDVDTGDWHQVGGETGFYTSVDEVTSDDDTTYVWLQVFDTSWWPIEWGLADSSGTGSINSVTVYYDCRVYSVPVLNKVRPFVRSGSTKDTGTERTLTQTYQQWSDVWNTNPDTSSAWTWNEIDSLQVGIDGYDENGDKNRVTQVYVVVDYTPNYAPVNDQTPVCTNLDDTDNLYARYKVYEISVSVTDANGYDDINYIELRFDIGFTADPVWEIRYTESTNIFTEEEGATYITESSSTYSKSGINIDLTIKLYIEWQHPDVTNYDFQQYVVDDFASWDLDTYSSIDYDVETRLDWSVAPAVTDDDAETVDRGDWDESFTMQGTLEYYGSVSSIAPPNDAVDVWISASEYGTNVGPWSDLLLSSGVASITCYADDATGSDIFTMKPVIDGAGSGGSTLYYTTDLTDAYIADRVVFAWEADDEPNYAESETSQTVNFDVRLEYDYDNADVTTGTWTLEGFSLTHAGTGTWEFADSEGTPTSNTYDTPLDSGSQKDDIHGISLVVTAGFTQNWDRLIINNLYSSDGDLVVNVGEGQIVYIQLFYDLDDSYVVDGDVDYTGGGGYDFDYTGSNGIWESDSIVRGPPSQAINFADVTNFVVTGNAHGITSLVDNGWDPTWFRWSNVWCVDGGITTVSRVDTGTSVTYWLTAATGWGHELGAGDTVYVNDGIGEYLMTWDAGDSRFELEYTPLTSAGLRQFHCTGYNLYEATYGLTSFNDLGNEDEDVIWDRNLVTLIEGDAEVVNLDIQVNFTVSIESEYDASAITAGTFSLRYGSTYLTLMHDADGNWTTDDMSASPTSRTYNYVNGTSSQYDISVTNVDDKTFIVSWDRIILTVWINHHWRVVDYNTTIWYTGVYEVSGWNWNGTATLNSTSGVYPVELSVANYTYIVLSITDPDYGVVAFSANDVWCIFDDAEVSSVAYYWTQYSVDQVWLIWQSGTWTWEINGTTLDTGADANAIIQSHTNDTDDDWAILSGTGNIGDLIIGSFNPSWYYVNLVINCETTVNGTAYDWVVWSQVLNVDILHSLQIVNFDIVPTDNYFWIAYQTNLLNASITIWDDAIDSGTLFVDNIYDSDFEGMHQIQRSSTIAVHNITICITSTGVNYDRDYTVHDYVWWYNFTYIIAAPSAYDCHIVILNNLFELIQFDVFEVYKNGTRIYHNIIQVTDGLAYNIVVKNRFGDTVNSTVFSADYEMVIFVNTYSFKFMNWYNGFLRVNVTRAGLTYSEIIMPMEIIEFNLFEATYTFTVDFLNGTTKFSQEITVTNSTGYVITGDSLTDVFDLVNTVYAMTDQINVTVTTTNNQVITISIDLININSTIWDQTVNILTNIENSNTTIYDQTISLISQLTNVNTTLYAQTVSILSDILNVNSTLFDQTVIILSNIDNINSTLYAQTVTLIANISNLDADIVQQTIDILADISNVNTTIYAQTVQMLVDIENVNTTLYAQTVTMLTDIANIDADIVQQTIDILADIDNVNSTIYAQTVTLIADIVNLDADIVQQTIDILADISNVNSTLYSQTVSILSNIINVNSTIYSQIIAVLSNISELNATMYLIDDPTHLNPMILGSTLSDDYCDFTIVTTWHNGTVSIYDNDVLVAGPISELLSPIRYPLSNTAGTHNLSFYIDGGNDYFWYNISYTVIETITIDTITLFGAGPDFTFMQWSFLLSIDCNYSIIEWSASVSTTYSFNGSLLAGDRNIAWEKMNTNDNYVNFTVYFTSGSLTYNFTSSYSRHSIPETGGSAIYEDNREYNTNETIVETLIAVEGDLYEGEDPDTAMWSTLGDIIFVIAVPSIGAMFYYLGLGRDRRKRRQPDITRGTDWRREMAGGNQR